jgi:CRP-like cAMP-binding protein
MLSRLPIFEGFDVEVIGDVMNALKSQVVGAHAPIASAGHPPDAMYFIVSGEAESEHPEGGVRHFGPGDFFGEAELLYAKPHSANVKARTHAQLLVLTADDFQTLMHKHAPLKERIEKHAAARAPGARRK